MRRLWLFGFFLFVAASGFATVFGTVRGIVHDPQHRPVANITVVLKARNSQFTQTTQTDSSGEFHFDAVSLGEYTASISDMNFVAEPQSVTVLSGTAPILHFELRLPSQRQEVTVSAESAQSEIATPSTLVDRMQIQETPGASRSNSLAMVTDFVPGAYLTHDQLHIRGHSNRFAYYGSLNGNRTSLGLEPPTTAVIHDAANGFGGFTSLIYNADPKDQFRFVGQSRRDFYQVPFDPNDPSTQGQFLHDANRESDSFAVFSWVRTLNPGLVITVSPFYHHNSANYRSSPQDFPSLATEKRASQYAGGQTTLSWVEKRNNLRGGLYGFAQEDDQTFGLVCNDPSQTQCQGSPSSPLSEMDNPSGSQLAAYAEDQIKATSWLTLNAGVRQTHFSGGVAENAASPRVGASLRVLKLKWVFRGFYGHFYQAPPLLTLSGPLIQLATSQNLGLVPLHGEGDEEHQFGVTIPFRGWTLDADNFLTRANNFFDHNNFNNSAIFIPITIRGARVSGWELILRSPRLHNRGQVYLTYSNQLALGCGGINGD